MTKNSQVLLTEDAVNFTHSIFHAMSGAYIKECFQSHFQNNCISCMYIEQGIEIFTQTTYFKRCYF